jgi:hypothetical protein
MGQYFDAERHPPNRRVQSRGICRQIGRRGEQRRGGGVRAHEMDETRERHQNYALRTNNEAKIKRQYKMCRPRP